MFVFVFVLMLALVATLGGGGGGPAGGGGDLMLLPLRLMRDEIEDDEIDDEDEVVFEAAPMLAMLTDLCGSLSKGFTRSCGSKLVTGLYPAVVVVVVAVISVVLSLSEALAADLTAEPAVTAAAAAGSSCGRLGCVEITSEPPDLPPEANENCLPRKEPLKPLPPLLVGPALLGTLPSPLLLLVSLAVLPRFLLAISYMSPNIPAKVFLRFFMVSSASSTTEL